MCASPALRARRGPPGAGWQRLPHGPAGTGRARLAAGCGGFAGARASALLGVAPVPLEGDLGISLLSFLAASSPKHEAGLVAAGVLCRV